MKILLAVLLSVLTLEAQSTVNGDRTFTGAVDASGATTTKPMKSGTTLPATCAVGEHFFKSDATAGQNIYGCTATNTWTQQGGSGSSLPSQTSHAGEVLTTDATTASWGKRKESIVVPIVACSGTVLSESISNASGGLTPDASITCQSASMTRATVASGSTWSMRFLGGLPNWDGGTVNITMKALNFAAGTSVWTVRIVDHDNGTTGSAQSANCVSSGVSVCTASWPGVTMTGFVGTSNVLTLAMANTSLVGGNAFIFWVKIDYSRTL